MNLLVNKELWTVQTLEAQGPDSGLYGVWKAVAAAPVTPPDMAHQGSVAPCGAWTPIPSHGNRTVEATGPTMDDVLRALHATIRLKQREEAQALFAEAKKKDQEYLAQEQSDESSDS